MKLTDYISRELIDPNLEISDKTDCLRRMVDMMGRQNAISDTRVGLEKILDREKMMSTGIGEGLAIPHGKSNCSKNLVMAVGRPAKPIDFDAVDGQPVYLVVLLASPPDKTSEHIQALGKISRLMADPNFRVSAYAAESAEEMYRLFEQAET